MLEYRSSLTKDNSRKLGEREYLCRGMELYTHVRHIKFEQTSTVNRRVTEFIMNQKSDKE